MNMKNNYKILNTHGDKVIVEWERKNCSFYPNGVEYSVHTLINDELYYGVYCIDLDDAKECFYKKTGVKL